MKKLKIISIILLFGMICSIGCKSKANCGSKSAHKKRHAKMNSFSPHFAY